MKIKTTVSRAAYALSFASLVFTSCQKGDTALPNDTAAATSSTIAVLASASVANADMVYIMQECRRGERRDSIAENALPATATGYLTTNYPGYTFHKAFVLKNRDGVQTGYVAVVYYNDKPVAVQFDTTGAFVKVLEQRERGDLSGPGWHRGGRFEHRDGQQKDTVALSALPAAVQSYLAASYASDTLVKAFLNRDNSLVVVSKNNGLFATLFDSTGTFVKREELVKRDGQHDRGRCQEIAVPALPAAVPSYLATAYPNYVLNKAFTVGANGTVSGYVVLIDANNTKYAVLFDAAGNFVSAKTIY